MARLVGRQPNGGWFLYSTVVNCIVAWDLTEVELARLLFEERVNNAKHEVALYIQKSKSEGMDWAEALSQSLYGVNGTSLQEFEDFKAQPENLGKSELQLRNVFLTMKKRQLQKLKGRKIEREFDKLKDEPEAKVGPKINTEFQASLDSEVETNQ